MGQGSSSPAAPRLTHTHRSLSPSLYTRLAFPHNRVSLRLLPPSHDFARPHTTFLFPFDPSLSPPFSIFFSKFFLYLHHRSTPPLSFPALPLCSPTQLRFPSPFSPSIVIKVCFTYSLILLTSHLIPPSLPDMDCWRVAVLGDGGVGKTALAVQVCVASYHPLSY